MNRSDSYYRILLIAVGAGVLAIVWDEIDPILRAGLVVALVLFGSLTWSRAKPTEEEEKPAEIGWLDRLVADETRRPWNPTTLPWLPTGPSPKPLLLVPAADYHLAEVVPLADELNRAGVVTRIAIGASPWERTRNALTWYPDLVVHRLPDAAQLEGEVSAVLVMKDTGSLQPLVTGCRERGIPTMGKVEGAQDFWDADTPEQRSPYRNLDLVLCQGSFDRDALADRATVVVGSSRLERLWWSPPAAAPEPLALINLNFVYGVGIADRRLWLETAIEGCERAGIPYLVSIHPAERARIESERATTISASRILPWSTVLISRFSTMPLEAMARGVPFVYHNPHGEAVRTFSEPLGAFEVTGDADELTSVLSNLDPGVEWRRRFSPFFARHVDVDPTALSEQRSARAIMDHLGLKP
ncbi:MAG TPA: hypothetical protein VIC07_06050 [Acidimicrobiia bacterium]|jgi:hypothetical protein